MMILTLAKKNQIIDEALRRHYRETAERKRTPNDYVLMFTEDGGANAVADAIEKAVMRKVDDNLIAFIRETELIAQDDYDIHFLPVWQQFLKTGEVPDYP